MKSTSEIRPVAASFDDIVFEHRNKLYGAYFLRRTYNQRILFAFFLTSLFFGGLVWWVGLHKGVMDVSQIIDGTHLEPDVYEIPYKKPVSEPKKRESGGGNPSPKGKPDLPPEVVKTLTPAVVKVDTAQSEGSQNGSGPSGGPVVPGKPGTGGGDGGGSDSVATTTEVHDIVDFMPEFPGGESALFRFLKKNLRFPSIMRDAQRETVVYVAFVVEKDGSIGAISILNPVAPAFEDEVVRVVRKMPNWQPGRIGSDNVPVRFKMPVRFVLQR